MSKWPTVCSQQQQHHDGDKVRIFVAGPSPRMEKKSVRKITNSAAAFYKSAGPNDERFYGKSMQKLEVFNRFKFNHFKFSYLKRYSCAYISWHQLFLAETRVIIKIQSHPGRGVSEKVLAVGFCLGSGLFGSCNSD